MSAAKTIKEEYLRLLCETCEVLLKMKQRAWNVPSVGGFKAFEEREKICMSVSTSTLRSFLPLKQIILFSFTCDKENHLLCKRDTDRKVKFF